jgi:hypothetical protein
MSKYKRIQNHSITESETNHHVIIMACIPIKDPMHQIIVILLHKPRAPTISFYPVKNCPSHHTPIVNSSYFHKRPVNSDFIILNQNVGPRNLDALPLIRNIKLSIIFQTPSIQDLAVIPITPPPRCNQASCFAAICI